MLLLRAVKVNSGLLYGKGIHSMRVMEELPSPALF